MEKKLEVAAGTISLADTLKGLDQLYDPKGMTEFVVTFDVLAPSDGHRAWLLRQYPHWVTRLNEAGIIPAQFNIIRVMDGHKLRFEFLAPGRVTLVGLANQRLGGEFVKQVNKDLAFQVIEYLNLAAVYHPLFAADVEDVYSVFWGICETGKTEAVLDGKGFATDLQIAVDKKNLPVKSISIVRPEVRLQDKSRLIKVIWGVDVADEIREKLWNALQVLINSYEVSGVSKSAIYVK